MTVRSEGQFNTVVYDTEDRYRGISGRNVVMINEKDMEKLNLQEGNRVTVKNETGEVPVDVALRYGNTYNDNILTFVNNINTIEGGTHLAGFKTALTRSLNKYANTNKILKTKKNESVSLSGDDVREGISQRCL